MELSREFTKTINDRQRDYYAILEVSRDANDDELRHAFRRLAFACHPDRNPDNPKATENFQLLQEAYAVLSDPEKRRAYDSGEDVVLTAQDLQSAFEELQLAIDELGRQRQERAANLQRDLDLILKALEKRSPI